MYVIFWINKTESIYLWVSIAAHIPKVCTVFSTPMVCVEVWPIGLYVSILEVIVCIMREWITCCCSRHRDLWKLGILIFGVLRVDLLHYIVEVLLVVPYSIIYVELHRAGKESSPTPRLFLQGKWSGVWVCCAYSSYSYLLGYSQVQVWPCTGVSPMWLLWIKYRSSPMLSWSTRLA